MDEQMEQKPSYEQKPKIPIEPSYGKRVWRLWGPFVIKWGISFVVSSVAVVLYMLSYGINYKEEVAKIVGDQEAILNFSLTISEQVLKYTTQIEGVAALLTIPILLILFHRDRKREKEYGVVPNKKAPLWKYFAIVIISAALCIGLNNLIMISHLSELSEGFTSTMSGFYEASVGMEIVCLAVFVPICEELVFRGLLFKRMREQGGFKYAALYSSLIFAIFHGNMVQMLYGFVLGYLLAYVCEKYGSIKAPILGHMILNMTSILATEYGIYEWLTQEFMRLAVLTVFCAFVSATMFVFIQRIEEKPDENIDKKVSENLATM